MDDYNDQDARHWENWEAPPAKYKGKPCMKINGKWFPIKGKLIINGNVIVDSGK
jgi:hypothetical protein